MAPIPKHHHNGTIPRIINYLSHLSDEKYSYVSHKLSDSNPIFEYFKTKVLKNKLFQ